MILTY